MGKLRLLRVASRIQSTTSFIFHILYSNVSWMFGSSLPSWPTNWLICDYEWWLDVIQKWTKSTNQCACVWQITGVIVHRELSTCWEANSYDNRDPFYPIQLWKQLICKGIACWKTVCHSAGRESFDTIAQRADYPHVLAAPPDNHLIAWEIDQTDWK